MATLSRKSMPRWRLRQPQAVTQTPRSTQLRRLISRASQRTDEHPYPHHPIPDDSRLQHHPGGVAVESASLWHKGFGYMKSLACLLVYFAVGLVIAIPMLSIIAWDGIRYLCGNKDALRCR
jgi:hypothetical protein